MNINRIEEDLRAARHDACVTDKARDEMLALIRVARATRFALDHMSYRPDSRWVEVDSALREFEF